MKVGFYSCMSGMPWGGSEVLWYKAARWFQRNDHEVAVNFKWWPYYAFQLQDLEKNGADIYLRNKPLKPLERVKSVFSSRNGTPEGWLEMTRPDAVLITLGYHPDRIPVADACHKLGIPYAINIQCASSFFFIGSDCLDDYRAWYMNAKKVFFVSDENRKKVENNLAVKLTNAEIVANPFGVPFDVDLEWPSSDPDFCLAVVGRVHFQSKGQDLVVDVLKQEKWRKRNVKVTFYGHDQGNKGQLEDLIKLNGLEDQLSFGGYISDVLDIWKSNHALLLPSRYEGAPLVVIESMLCNRMAISTNIGRNHELMDDNISGFIAEGATVALVDDALERAWQQRDRWQEIGKLAGQHIRERYPEDPIGEYADKIQKLLEG